MSPPIDMLLAMVKRSCHGISMTTSPEPEDTPLTPVEIRILGVIDRYTTKLVHGVHVWPGLPADFVSDNENQLAIQSLLDRGLIVRVARPDANNPARTRRFYARTSRVVAA